MIGQGVREINIIRIPKYYYFDEALALESIWILASKCANI
jgi:hypothetical protein